ncbi:MAG: putative polysaccharide biosynthesis protein [Halanaerobium sp.]
MEKNKKFIRGALTLGAAGIISKLLGFTYRVALPRLIGSEGVGIYQLAYPIYTILLVISTSGMPIALAKIISKENTENNYQESYKIFKTAKILNFFTGLLLTILMIYFSKSIINLFNWDQRALYSVIALAPAVFIVSLVSVFRGFFQGLQDMKPTAYSQVLEQLIRILAMIFMVKFFLPYGIKYAAAAATLGAVIGALAALILLIIIYYKNHDKIWQKIPVQKINSYEFKHNSKKIIALALPITIGALITPLMGFIDAAIVPTRLEAGGFINPLALYGELAGMAMVLVHFPTVITLALATSLVPAISEAFALGDQKLLRSRAETALRITILISLPAAVGLFLLAKPLSAVIFEAPSAAVPLYFVSWGVIFIALKQVTSAMLQGLGRVKIPARNLLIGSLFNALLNYILTAHPAFGIKGAAIGTISGFIVASFLNLIYVKKWTDFNIDFNKLFLKPVISVLAMAAAVKSSQYIFLTLFSDLNLFAKNILSLLISIIIGIIIYSAALILTKEIKYHDLILIPYFGKKAADLLEKYNILEK